MHQKKWQTSPSIHPATIANSTTPAASPLTSVFLYRIQLSDLSPLTNAQCLESFVRYFLIPHIHHAPL